MSNEIAKEVVSLLRNCECKDNHLVLPEGTRLKAEFRLELNAAVAKLGGTWKPSAKAFVFETDPQAVMNEIMFTGLYPLNEHIGYFDTLPRMIAPMFNFVPPDTVKFLEPSVGEGVIAKAILEKFPKAQVAAVELNPRLWNKAKKIDRERLVVINDNFLRVKNLPRIQCVVMCPPPTSPTSNIEYVAHFRWAFNLLPEGAKLIGLAPIGLAYSEHPEVKALRDMIAANGGTITPLSPKILKVKGVYVAMSIVHVNRKG